ncbi:MAG TPA: error-prone DNA polymerase [Casimicrobiaceae bacterium]|nr:error-prone DNA polymerase [Casimicrobiaceae bacterium]
MLPSYAELHCLTNFSFLRGASHPEELVERAHALGYAGLAITDECSIAGVVRAHLAAKEIGLPLVIGSEFVLACGMKLVLYAVDRESYGDLAQLITCARRAAVKGTYRLTRDDVERFSSRCLALWSPEDPLTQSDDGAHDAARWIADRFDDRARLAVELFAQAGDATRFSKLQRLSHRFGLPLAAAGDVVMHARARRALQDTLTAIRLGTPVAQCGYALYPNGERHLRSRARIATLYPRPLTDATLDVVERCRFSLDELRYEYPREIVPKGETPTSWLRKLTEQGLARRYGNANPTNHDMLHGEQTFRFAGAPPDVRELIEYELALIAELRYEPYFLTVQDIVAFARSRDILCQGRGSAANSAVCYALGITEVDPSRMSMLFERFISRERNEPPDIDVDFEHQRREEVMQYVYQKYGRDRAALAATLICYRPRSAVRDVGKALGLDLAQVDRLASGFAWWDGPAVLRECIGNAGFDPDSPMIRRLVKLTSDLMGFPRHLSQHVGGFVIARDLLERMVPVENAAMKDRTVIQWDKDDLDAMGLLKVDCLALGMLSAIRRAIEMIGAQRGAPMRVQDIPPEDPAVYAMIQRADTIGVFQIESRAQQSMLPRLKPKTFYDLVVEVAIVRPGPIQGGMVHPYLKRRQGLEPITYPSEAVKGVLERTLGVPIFQEQVMQLAIVAAGFTPGEADRLRRAMAAWRRRGGLEKFEQRLIDGMAERGYDESFARQIYQQILGFGEYGFPESHSASFAMLVYVSCWIKRHYPAAFAGALLNSQPMGFYAPAQLVADAREHGVDVRNVDVTVSDWDCTLESDDCATTSCVADNEPSAWGKSGPALRLGLRIISGLKEAAVARIVAARNKASFNSVADLAHRAKLDRRDLQALADAGALAKLAGHRHYAVWEVAGIEWLPALIADSEFDERAPKLPAPTEGQDIVADYRRLGLTLRRHPLALLRKLLASKRMTPAREIRAMPHGRLVRAAGIVIGRQRPDTASGVVFVTLEDETGTLNVIVWRDLGDRQRRELLSSRLMAVYGKVEREGAVVHVLAGRLVDLSPMLGALETRSRDFH